MSALLWPGVLWLFVAAIAITLIVSLKRLDKEHPKPDKRSHLDEWHHGWLILLPIGVLAVLTLPFSLVVIAAVALALIAADDAWQHYVQAYRNKPDYHSLGWRVYRRILEIFK